MALALYMIRAPMYPGTISDAFATGTVIYRSKIRLGPKRNLRMKPGAQWLLLGVAQT